MGWPGQGPGGNSLSEGMALFSAILLFGQDFWQRLIDFEYLVETGMISKGDLGLFHYVETAEQAWAVLAEHYGFDLPDTGIGDLAIDI